MIAFRASPGLEIGEVDLGLDFVAVGARRAGDRLEVGARCWHAETGADFVRFVVFERTGMASSSR